MISENLRSRFNVAIIVLMSCSILFLVATFAVAFGWFIFEHNSILVLLLGIMALVMGVSLRALVRHMHDQVDTYYKAQKWVRLLGVFSTTVITISGLLVVPIWAFTTVSSATENSNFVIFYVQCGLFSGFVTFGIWAFQITRNLRFLNLISSHVKNRGYGFGFTSILIPILVWMLWSVGYTSPLLILLYVPVFTLAIAWYAGLYSNLTK